MKRHIVITQKKTDYAMPRSIHTAYRMNFQLITLTCKEIKNESDLCFYYCAANNHSSKRPNSRRQRGQSTHDQSPPEHKIDGNCTICQTPMPHSYVEIRFPMQQKPKSYCSTKNKFIIKSPRRCFPIGSFCIIPTAEMEYLIRFFFEDNAQRVLFHRR